MYSLRQYRTRYVMLVCWYWLVSMWRRWYQFPRKVGFGRIDDKTVIELRNSASFLAGRPGYEAVFLPVEETLLRPSRCRKSGGLRA